MPLDDPLKSIAQQMLKATEAMGVFSTPVLPMKEPSANVLWELRVAGPVL
jgi:hypothetical protein